MDKEIRDYLRSEVSKRSKERADNGFLDCDPESLTRRANEAYDLGLDEIGDALSRFRDLVVNQLLGEGWTLDRIEQAAYRHWTGKDLKW